MSKLSNLLKKILVLSLLCMQFSCYQGKLDPFDTQNGLSRGDIKKTLSKNTRKELERKKTAQVEAAEIPIPTISKLIMTPPPPVIGGNKTISFSVTDQVPLKDVLIELGRVAQIDVDLDPAISGGVIINAKNRPFKEVIDRIATQGRLRYTYENGILHFERDAPIMKTYHVDYLIDGQLWSDVETNINALLSASSSSEPEGDATSSMPASSISSNKTAGLISIFATEKEHKTISEYLAIVEESASAQVLIEAKIVEVSLTETFKAGINWTSLTNNISAAGGTVAAAGGITASGIGLFGGSLTASAAALETFGSTRTIASPRINAINNQKASLNFGDTLVYFKIDANQNVTTTGASAANTSTITSTKQELDVGTKLEITPSINIKTGEILMKIVPTLSIEGDVVVDPASPHYTDSNGNDVTISNNVPQVNTRTMETMAKIKSGSVIVIGGLMKDTTKNTDTGVPFLSAIPVLGWLFKSIDKSTEIVETVIFIKATIIKTGAPVDKVDRDLQQKLDSNRRRFFNN